MLYLACAITFAVASVYDLLTIIWTRSCRQNKVRRAVMTGVALETLAWVPTLALVVTWDWRVAAASIAGSAVGIWLTLSYWPESPRES